MAKVRYKLANNTKAAGVRSHSQKAFKFGALIWNDRFEFTKDSPSFEASSVFRPIKSKTRRTYEKEFWSICGLKGWRVNFKSA